MPVVEITTLDHPALAPFCRLTETQLRNRLEPQLGLFIAESPKVIALALDAGCTPVALLCERRHLHGDAAPLTARCPELPVYTGERALLAQLTGYELTRGVLCAMRRPAPQTPEQVCRGARCVAVADGVVNATNIGAIFRAAAALNVDAVLLTPTCCDPLNRRAVRVSMGSVFLLPWARVEEPVEPLRRMGFRTAALGLRPDALPIHTPLPHPERPLALILGAEGDGLSPTVMQAADHVLRIPMSRGVDSLNVAAAAAIAFYMLADNRPPQGL